MLTSAFKNSYIVTCIFWYSTAAIPLDWGKKSFFATVYLFFPGPQVARGCRQDPRAVCCMRLLPRQASRPRRQAPRHPHELQVRIAREQGAKVRGQGSRAEE